MFNKKYSEQLLLDAGYIRVSQKIAKAVWSNAEIEHYIYFAKETRGYLVASFGLRNVAAEKFGIHCLKCYGHKNFLFSINNWDPSSTCSMNFDFSRLDNFSGNLWPRICLLDRKEKETAEVIASFIKLNLTPEISDIVDLTSYLVFLLQNVEPWPWFAVNRAIRAA